MNAAALTQEDIKKLQKLKAELELITNAMHDLEGKNTYEVEGRIRAFQDKESEIKKFLRDHGLNG